MSFIRKHQKAILYAAGAWAAAGVAAFMLPSVPTGTGASGLLGAVVKGPLNFIGGTATTPVALS